VLFRSRGRGIGPSWNRRRTARRGSIVDSSESRRAAAWWRPRWRRAHGGGERRARQNTSRDAMMARTEIPRDARRDGARWVGTSGRPRTFLAAFLEMPPAAASSPPAGAGAPSATEVAGVAGAGASETTGSDIFSPLLPIVRRRVTRRRGRRRARECGGVRLVSRSATPTAFRKSTADHDSRGRITAHAGVL